MKLNCTWAGYMQVGNDNIQGGYRYGLLFPEILGHFLVISAHMCIILNFS